METLLITLLGDSYASITQLAGYLHPLRALLEKCKELFTPEEETAIEKVVLDKMICPWWIIPAHDREILDDVVNRARRHCEEWEKFLPRIWQRCNCDDKEKKEKHCLEAWKRSDEAEKLLQSLKRLRHFLTM